jgi:hypothetical protein
MRALAITVVVPAVVTTTLYPLFDAATGGVAYVLAVNGARLVMTGVPLAAVARVEPGTRYTSTLPAVRLTARSPIVPELAVRLGRASVVVRNFWPADLAGP